MGMWELDTLLKESIQIILNSSLDVDERRIIVWNLETLPERYEFDAGKFERTETDKKFEYKLIDPYVLGFMMIKESDKQKNAASIYNWTAFMLNHWEEYFPTHKSSEFLKENYFAAYKITFRQYNFTAHKPIHASLTVFPEGNEWFSEKKNEMINWFNK